MGSEMCIRDRSLDDFVSVCFILMTLVKYSLTQENNYIILSYIRDFLLHVFQKKPPPVRQQLFLQVPIAIPMHRAVLFSINDGSLPVIRDLFYSGIAFKIHIPACTVLCVSILWPAACFTPQPSGTGSMPSRIYQAYPFKPCARFLSIFAGR